MADFVLKDDPLPDHPWDENNQTEGFCLTCGAQQIIHDGNLDKVFDWMERLNGASRQGPPENAKS